MGLSQVSSTHCIVLCGKLNCPDVVTPPCCYSKHFKTKIIYTHYFWPRFVYKGNTHYIKKNNSALWFAPFNGLFPHAKSMQVFSVIIINGCGQSSACSMEFASSGLFSHWRYISLVRWLWLSCLIWEGSFLSLKHTCSDQMWDWNSINLLQECLSTLVFSIKHDQKGPVYHFVVGGVSLIVIRKFHKKLWSKNFQAF